MGVRVKPLTPFVRTRDIAQAPRTGRPPGTDIRRLGPGESAHADPVHKGQPAPGPALRVTKKLSPGQRGAVALTRQFGDALICVRHREDTLGAFRYVTVELLIERTAIVARNQKRVGIRIDFREADLRAAIKRHGATWDAHRKVWAMDRKTVSQLGLQARIVIAY